MALVSARAGSGTDLGPRVLQRCGREPRGTTLLEMLFVVSIIGVVCAIAIPQLLSGLDDLRTRAAARYLAGRFQDARFQSVKRSLHVGVRFAADGGDFRMATFADGNHNGLRTKEIAAGTDPAVIPDVSFASLFPHVRIGIGAGVPLIDGGTSADPVLIGSGNILTFSPDGTSSAGSVYVLGDAGAQYAVRVLGVTGRTRVFRYQRSDRAWKPM
jgi:prepilin-type N-terminal cleavage/methylation domain-containing protein